MDWLYLSGRILYSMIFVGSGIGHFVQLEGMSRYAASKGLPAPRLLVLTSGAAILSGGLSVMIFGDVDERRRAEEKYASIKRLAGE
jgi:uncharacterized membrane protein YphA (DoxX/SURF4 family)